MRRFFVDRADSSPLAPGQRVSLDPEESRHLLQVLRADDGATVAVTDGRGADARGRLVVREGRIAVLEIVEVSPAAAEIAPPLLVVACAVVKGKRFEFALEKAVELGAHRFVPLGTERGVIDPRAGKQDRWRGLVTAALKQSGRCWLPELRPVTPLNDLLTATDTDCVYFGAAPADVVAERPLAPVEAAVQAARRRQEGEMPPERLVLVIGPEGGWTASELSLLAHAGAVPLLLGPHVLRTETAAVAGLAALQGIRSRWQTDRPGPA